VRFGHFNDFDFKINQFAKGIFTVNIFLEALSHRAVWDLYTPKTLTYGKQKIRQKCAPNQKN
jgi:hypothetical protein